MIGEISYDLVMKKDMGFVEGSYRLDDGNWRVFIFSKASIQGTEIQTCRWTSGIEGIVVRVPESVRLNKQVVEQIMSESLKVKEWREIPGPDSMQLR